MDYLRDYKTLDEMRQSWATPVKAPSMPGQLKGQPKMQGIMSVDPQRQAELDLAEARKGVLTGVQSDYLKAQEEITGATTDADAAYAEAKKQLGTPESALDKAYAEIDKNFIDVWLVSDGYDPATGAKTVYEGKYRMHPDDLNKAWKDSLETDADLALTKGVGPDGKPVMMINVKGYGKEAHEGMAKIKGQYMDALAPSVYESYGQANKELSKAYGDASKEIYDYQQELDTQGIKLGTMAADHQVRMGSDMEGTAAKDAYEGRRDERQAGFKVLRGGQ